ncbi:Cro/Cl family transcriptional regulator [Pseudomonas sp. AF32]|uniref:CS1 type fimbrial major subunit n=1 Tax=Pseudomonas sp. AF32 TaxID=554390 RepID=UPI001EEF11AE|nr:CS1 type fimbrial major subunit [Pseudomonas sp. AF32]MCG6573521.1 Cro/Cl family transcriptional regulator [Pseudomonas sp. AF32]
MKLLQLAPLALAALVSLPAVAVEKSILVYADVDPTIELLQSDGSPLPASMEMAYLPGAGLQPTRLGTRIFSNDTDKDMTLRLITNPVLANMTNPAATGVPLSISFGGRALNTTGVSLSAADLFPGGDPTSGSIEQMLDIRQTTVGAITNAGRYEGIVSLVLTQQP